MKSNEIKRDFVLNFDEFHVEYLYIYLLILLNVYKCDFFEIVGANQMTWPKWKLVNHTMSKQQNWMLKYYFHRHSLMA